MPVEEDKSFSSDSKSFISIRSPEYGAKYRPGEAINIKWESTTSVERVNIEIFKKDQSRGTIAYQISNEGQYNWYIPIDFLLSVHYKIKITSSRNPEVFSYSGVFSIGLQ
jgi:hypothetical protein